MFKLESEHHPPPQKKKPILSCCSHTHVCSVLVKCMELVLANFGCVYRCKDSQNIDFSRDEGGHVCSVLVKCTELFLANFACVYRCKDSQNIEFSRNEGGHQWPQNAKWITRSLAPPCTLEFLVFS